MSIIEGKVAWKKIKENRSGYSMLFGVDGFEGILSMFGKHKEDLEEDFPFEKGDQIKVEYRTTDKGFNNVDAIVCLEKQSNQKTLNNYNDEALKEINEKLDILLKRTEDPYAGHQSATE